MSCEILKAPLALLPHAEGPIDRVLSVDLPPEVHARGAEAGEVVVEEYVHLGDRVANLDDLRVPPLDLRAAISLERARELRQAAVPDEAEVHVVALGPAQSDPAVGEPRIRLRREPRAVAELDRVPVARGELVDERLERWAARPDREPGRQLHHERTQFRPEDRDRGEEPSKRVLDVDELLVVRDQPWELGGESERFGRGFEPRAGHVLRRDRVERGVDLDDVEHASVERQVIGRLRAVRIEGSDPFWVRPPHASYAHKCHGRSYSRRYRLPGAIARLRLRGLRPFPHRP